MKKLIIISGMLGCGLISCDPAAGDPAAGDPDKKTNPYLEYRIHVDKDGETIKEDDFVAISYTETTEDDSVLSSSFGTNNNLKLMFRERSQFKGDLFAALGMLSEGDSATFRISIDSLALKARRFRHQDMDGKHLVYHIKVHKVVARENLGDSLYNSRIMAYRQEVTEAAKENEQNILKQYISAKNLQPQSTGSGLHYIVLRKGAGRRAVAGDSVWVHYTGRLLNGKVFDTCDSAAARLYGIYNESRPYGPVKLPVEKETSGSGFREALKLFPKGTKAMLIIPSRLAYGETGFKFIPPYTPLVCEMEIVDIVSAR